MSCCKKIKIRTTICFYVFSTSMYQVVVVVGGDLAVVVVEPQEVMRHVLMHVARKINRKLLHWLQTRFI
jgi:hypothetical protein